LAAINCHRHLFLSLTTNPRAKVKVVLKMPLWNATVTLTGLRFLKERKALFPTRLKRRANKTLKHPTGGVSVRTVVSLAEALQTSPEWLISGTDPEEVSAEAQQDPGVTAGLRLAGAVGAGLWLEGAGLWLEAASENNDKQLIAVPPDPRYPADYQCAYEVRGTSIDRFARLGDFLMVVDRKVAGLALRSGDIAIVTQTKNGLREITARRFRTRTTAPGCELTFESSNPKFNAGIWLPHQESTESFSLGGIVVGVYRPLG
jgi:hypothetical protein